VTTLSKPKTLLSFIYNTTVVPNYRTEMHMDMRRSFERFKVTDGATQAACFQIEEAAYWFRQATSDVEAKQIINQTLYEDAQRTMVAGTEALFAQLETELAWMVLHKPEFETQAPLEREINVNGADGQERIGFGPVALPPASGVRMVKPMAEAGAGAPRPRMGARPGAAPWYPFLSYVYYFFHYKEVRAELRRNPLDLEQALAPLSGALKPAADASRLPVLDALLALGESMDSGTRSKATPSDIRGNVKELCDVLSLEYRLFDWPWCW
jgi:hypothetical protein